MSARSFAALLFLSVNAISLGAQTSPSPTVNIRRIAALNQSVWPGDFNGDGITDLAATAFRAPNDPPPSVVVALGRGDGSFAAATSIGWTGHVFSVADFNNDSKRDLLIGDIPVDNSEVYIALGNGDGTFTSSRRVNSFDYPLFALASDLDGNGFLDVIVGDSSGSIQIYPGRADGTYPDIIFLTAGALPLDGAVADLNGDSRKDLIVANHDGHSLSVFLNQGAFNFIPSDIPFDRQVNDVVAADVNRDGRMDLIAATSRDANDDFNYMEGDAAMLSGNGDGTFPLPVSYATAPGAWQIVVGDFTRDGILDVATANRSAIYAEDCGPLLKGWDSVSILPGKSDGTFGAASSFSLGNQSVFGDPRFTNSVQSLNTSDVNRDGALDLIASWGAILINRSTDPNWPPSVTLGPDRAANPDGSVTLEAMASDVDQDRLTYSWVDGTTGEFIAPVPNPCYTPTRRGVHSITVTVSDGHGHSATDEVAIDFGTGGTWTPPSVTFSAPAGGEVIQAGAPFTIRWTVNPGSHAVARIDLYTYFEGNAPNTLIAECSNLPPSATSCQWNNPGPASETAHVTAVVTDSTNQFAGTTSNRFSIRAQTGGGLPAGWSHADIGAVAAAGDATYDSGTGVFTVSGSGADIWGTADEFHFAYQQMDTQFEIVTRVDSVQNVHAWTKAGLMVRTSLDPSAPQASIFVTPGKGIAFQRRTDQGATSINTSGAALTAPVWLRLAGYNGNIWAYYKKNLTDRWAFLGQQVLSEYGNASPYVGLAVTSHADGTLATAKFSQVRSGTIPDWAGRSIGCTDCSSSHNGSFFGLFSRSTDIWGVADAFSYIATPFTGDGTITARVLQIDNTHAWAKAAVMLRETDATNSKHVFAMVTPGKGVNLQYRAATGGQSASAGTIAGVAPGWLRLQRAGNTFTASWSTDGVTFAAIGSITVAMDSSILVGMAHTSHNTSVGGGANFEDVFVQR